VLIRIQDRCAAKIEVRDNQIEPALKALKKLMLKDGLFQEMKRDSLLSDA